LLRGYMIKRFNRIKAKRALERGYLNVKAIKVIKSCRTEDQLRVADRYLNLILDRLRYLFNCEMSEHDAVTCVRAYNTLKDNYYSIMAETTYRINRKVYKKTFGISFKNSVK